MSAALAAPCAAAPQIAEVIGKASIQRTGAQAWSPAANGDRLNGGDQVRTGKVSHARIIFDDKTRIELGADASFTLQESAAGSTSVKLGFGFLRAWVAKAAGQRFQVRTPTAVCSVRGTEFSVDVNAQGHTAVQMFEGVLGVADMKGNEAEIRDKQGISVTDKGLGAVQGEGQQQKGEGRGEKLKEAAKREVGLEMSKEAVQAAAALEAKTAVFQQGKAIIDVNGNRVRIEEYIVRPSANEFKLVVLNERVNRFDYFYYHGVFNTVLPDDISIALRQLPGCLAAACQYFLTNFDTGRSNTIDNMLETATGGHQIDVNNDGNAADAVSAAFDPATDRFIALAPNQPFFQTLFNTNVLTFNGVMHTSWAPQAGAGAACGSPGNICSMAGAEVAFNNITTVQNPPACGPPNCTFTEDGVLHQVVYSQNAAGTIWDKFDSYIISDEGKIATTADFAGATTGTEYKKTLLNWNFQQIVTASEFGGRTIDLAVEPKIFIQSGLIP